MEKWTKENIPGLSGKVIIVTGGNSGLGYESVKAFAEKGADVVMTSRSIERGEKARSKIGEVRGKISVMQLDLEDFSSIERFAEDFKKRYDRLDVLMNNAGIMFAPYFETKEGLEAQNGINHFGHFALTGRLLGILMKTPRSRVVTVSSNAHKYGKMDWDNLLFEDGKGYSRLKSYARSKLANLLFTHELQRKLKESGSDTIALAAHPGTANTNLVKYIKDKWWFKVFGWLLDILAQDAEKGALPQIRAAVDPEAKGGQYWGPHKGTKGYPVLASASESSKNKEDAGKLWEISEKITGVHYNI